MNPQPIIVISPGELEEIIAKAFVSLLGSGMAPAGKQTEPVEIIDTKELCTRLNITEQTILRLRQKDKIPFLLIGDCIRYDWYSVLKATQKNKS